MEILNTLFKLAVESGASDVIVKSDKPGYLRIDGRLISVDMEPIDFEVVRMFIEVNMPKVFRALGGRRPS
jgi:twitching motility protein PilT